MDGNYKDKVKTISTLPFTECFHTSLLSVPAFIPIEGQCQRHVNLNDKISSTSGFHGKFCPTRYVAIFIGFAKICKNIGRSHRVGGVACCWKFPSRPVSSAAALLSGPAGSPPLWVPESKHSPSRAGSLSGRGSPTPLPWRCGSLSQKQGDLISFIL